MKVTKAYTFDDLMLVPQYSEIESRKDPDISTKLGSIELKIPIIAAPMNTICEYEMLRAMYEIGATGVLHRYMSIDDQVGHFVARYSVDSASFVAVGASGDYLERVRTLIAAGAKHFVVDVANGYNISTMCAIEEIRKLVKDGLLMAGNICTAAGTVDLINAGVDIIRVGIGPGSACTTRVVTGHGIPQLTAIENCVKSINNLRAEVYCVADGGIRSSGDIVKALAIGADAVMIGGLLAGTSQSPGDACNEPEGLFKYFHGMASEKGRQKWFDKEITSFVPEGSSAKVPFRGCAMKIVEQLANALRVGMSYSGAATLAELREKAQWVEISRNGYIEGRVNRRMHGGRE